MVAFVQTMGGYSVEVNDKPFGWISKERGFFTDPTVVKDFLEISSFDLRSIAAKVDEVRSQKYCMP